MTGLIGLAEEAAANAVVPGSGALVHIGLWLRKHWQTIVVVVLVVGAAALVQRAPWAERRGFHSRDGEVAGLKKQYADLQAADAKAQADAIQHALDVEHAQDQAKEVQAHETQDLLARARADAAAYAGRLRAQAAGAAKGDGQQSAPGEGGGAAGGADGTGGLSLMDAGDLQACTDNTVKALGWQSFWAKLKAIPR